MASSRATTPTTGTTPTATIQRLDVSEHALAVHWDDAVTSEYPWLWLRDHAHDAATLHPVTQQRQLYTAGVDPDLRGAAARIDGDDVAVTWEDETPPSRLPIYFLASFRQPRPARVAVDVDRVLWDRALIAEQWPTVQYREVIDGDDGVAAWLSRVATYGFCIVEGTPVTVEASQELIRRVGYIRETIFGGFWDFQADLSKADTAYTNLELLPHTDGTYSHDAPGSSSSTASPSTARAASPPWSTDSGSPTSFDATSPAIMRCSRPSPSRASTSVTVRTSSPPGRCSATTRPASWCRCRSTTPIGHRSSCRPTR